MINMHGIYTEKKITFLSRIVRSLPLLKKDIILFNFNVVIILFEEPKLLMRSNIFM